jgi:YggT family protein
MPALQTIYTFVTWGVTALIVAAIILILLRSLFNYLDVNPFTWSAINVRRATDPVILPVRRALISFRLEPKVAPFIVILLILIAGFLAVQLAGSLLNTIAGVLYALTSGRIGMPVAIIGYLLFGLLGLYTLVIFVRIIFSWGMMGYGNRWMRFLIRITEPLLAPLRRMVPMVGMFDVSPIVAFLILWLLQAAVGSTLLRGWPVQFF